MPYIKKEDRVKFKDDLPEVIGTLVEHGVINVNVGELNFVISSIIWRIFDENPSYTLGNNLMGVLECVKQEFYRRKLAPYEDEKIKTNGDI